MASHIPVLIIGAGPTGLLMACELARRELPFRIIDKKPERTLTANAVGIQTRTLELLDHLGVLHEFLKLGHECRAVQLHANGKDLARISFEHLDSLYHFILTLPQSETERLLNEHLEELKCEVERPIELTALKQEDQGFRCTLTSLESGESETLVCDWLIACDGANSKVRELCQVPFPGEDLAEQFMVANSQMSTFLPTNEIHGFFNHGTFLFAIPFGSHSYRIGLNLHQSPRKFLIEKEVKELIQERSQGDYDVNSVSWISPFWIHSKIVKQLRYGSLFLLGDAAHIHSPAGAQGMNTGLQDAYNLAWKLALVVQGRAKPELLDSYQAERYPIVSGIVKRAENFTRLALFENPFLQRLRNLLFKFLNSRPRFSQKFSMRLTQLNLRYKNSPVISYREKINRRAPRPGERVPDVLINQSTRLHTYLRGTEHKALLFTGLANREKDQSALRELQQWLKRHYSETIRTFIISNQRQENLENFIFDDQNRIHQRYHLKNTAIYLIRPDNCIAFCSKNLAPAELKAFLEIYLT